MLGERDTSPGIPHPGRGEEQNRTEGGLYLRGPGVQVLYSQQGALISEPILYSETWGCPNADTQLSV